MEEGVLKCIKRIGIYFAGFDYRVGMALNGDHAEWLVPFLFNIAFPSNDLLLVWFAIFRYRRDRIVVFFPWAAYM